jgi:DNA-binding GntR family transcriptional regulator
MSSEDSLVDRVYAHVYARLYEDGILRPEKLSVVALSSELGVSRTPVRLALERLRNEGLVRYSPTDNGWTTIPVTKKDLEEILDLQEALESIVVRRAAERIDRESAKTLLGASTAMQDAARAGDLAKWLEADRRYHNLLYDLAGNERLRQILGRLDNQFFRLHMGHIVYENRMGEAAREHQSLAEAIIAGDVQLALERLLEHTGRLRASTMKVIDSVLIPLLGQRL